MARAPSRIAVGEAIVSRQPLLPQEQGLPPRFMTGIWPISAHCSLLPRHMRPFIDSDAPMPYSQRRKNCELRSSSLDLNIWAANSARTLLDITHDSPVSASKRSHIGKSFVFSAPKLFRTMRPSGEVMPRMAMPRPMTESFLTRCCFISSASRAARRTTVSSASHIGSSGSSSENITDPSSHAADSIA